MSGYVVSLVSWAGVYRLGSYGVKNFGFYLDPVHNPGRYLISLLSAIPIYLASQHGVS